MADYGQTDTSTTSLGTNQFPVSAVFVPGDTKLTTLEGGPTSTDGNGKTSSPAAVTVVLRAALADWSSQPTQTTAAAADTVLKWGTGGATPFNHIAIQNNSSQNFTYAFDQDSTAAHAKIYVLTPGQIGAWDRVGSALHCNTPSQVTFGGTGGITVETFA